ncbi:MAG: 7-cyano-7-deazaguanine synthase QueC [Myxococcota bacterium]
MRREDKAVVLLSGGMDSATTLAIARERYRVVAVHFNYHQKTERKELWCFNKLCDYYKVERRIVIDTDFFLNIGGSTLIKGSKRVPLPRFKEGKIPSTYVPFRNGIMLSLAAAIADRFKAKYIYIGAVEADSSGYPDCRIQFIKAFEDAIRKGTRIENLSIVAPLIAMSKAQIVKMGVRLNVPYKYTWSCYRSNIMPCKRCESCILRERGFEGASIKDPLLY